MIELFLKNKIVNYSPKAQEAYKTVNRPFGEREQCEYNFSFLENYTPNNTYFLSKEKREYLHNIGDLRKNLNKDFSANTKLIYSSLIIDFSYASSKLEGNTYNYIDTKTLIEKGQVSLSNSVEDTTMVLNHKSAIEYIFSHIDSINYDTSTIKIIHGFLADDLIENEMAIGEIRKCPAGIGNSGYQPLFDPEKIAIELKKIMTKVSQIKDPYEQSIFLLTFIPYLQTFEDVNKRTSRVFCNIPLIKNGLCPISFLQVDTKDYCSAMLSIYENNDISILQDLYVSMYESSVAKYIAIDKNKQRYIPDKDAVRLRTNIFKCVTDIVKYCIDSDYYIEHLPYKEEDKLLLKKYVNKRLEGLSESNLPKYGLTLEDLYNYQNYKDNNQTMNITI